MIFKASGKGSVKNKVMGKGNLENETAIIRIIGNQDLTKIHDDYILNMVLDDVA